MRVILNKKLIGTRGNFIVDGGKLVKMIISKKKSYSYDSIEDIICDYCGSSCKTQIHQKIKNFEFATLNASWGYYSDSDGKSYKIQLCEKCFYDVIAHIKLNCKVNNGSLDGNIG